MTSADGSVEGRSRQVPDFKANKVWSGAATAGGQPRLSDTECMLSPMTEDARRELITVAQAAEILGMTSSGTFKLTGRNELSRRGDARGRRDETGVVRLDDVVRLAERRAREKVERRRRRDAPPAEPVDRRP